MNEPPRESEQSPIHRPADVSGAGPEPMDSAAELAEACEWERLRWEIEQETLAAWFAGRQLEAGESQPDAADQSR